MTDAIASKSMKIFDSLPENIKSQYQDPRPVLESTEKDLGDQMEDPKLVVDAVVDAVTDLRPAMWYFPGRGAYFIR